MATLVALLVLAGVVTALDNGLARTPPMGWLSWEAFGCNTDCVNDPDYCLSEKLIMQMADRMAEDGYRDVGYEYVCIDDCWLAPSRDASNNLQPDPARFPSGMKALADYVHSKGLKLGIYEDFGTKTCAGFPGSEFHLEQDAKTFASWGIDLLKFDTCNSDSKDNKYGFPAMSMYLNQTGRPILFSCEWPYGELQQNDSISSYTEISKYCNIWRVWWDVSDDFNSINGIVNVFARNNDLYKKFNGPGGFFDPDMVLVGGFGLSDNAQRSQMAMWAMFSAPLLMSNDLRAIPDKAKQLAQNKLLISVNQDPLGKMATKLWELNGLQLWVKPISPPGSVAVTFYNPESHSGTPVSMTAGSMGMVDARGYIVTEVFTGRSLGKLLPTSLLKFRRQMYQYDRGHNPVAFQKIQNILDSTGMQRNTVQNMS